jgi:hypothetical protein
MSPLVALVMLAGSGEVTADLPVEAPEPRVVVDFYPAATTNAFAFGLGGKALWLYVPLSATVVIGPSTALHAEVAFGAVGGDSVDRGFSFSAAVGPIFSFGPSALQGFFIGPKLSFQLSSAVTVYGGRTVNFGEDVGGGGPLDLGPEWSRAFLVGADIGYQWTWSGRHIAVMIGASVGYEFDAGGPEIDPFGVQRGEARRGLFFSGARTQGFAYSVNGNLFRIGFAL